MMLLLAGPQLVLHNPGRGYEAETADSDQHGGQEHPEAAHTAEHSDGSLGEKSRRQTKKIDPEPGFFFFFLFPAQKERMHLELTPSGARLQLQPPAQHYMSQRGEIQSERICRCGCVSPGPRNIWSDSETNQSEPGER